MVKWIDVTHDDGRVERFAPVAPTPEPTPVPKRSHVGVNLFSLSHYTTAAPFVDFGLLLSKWIGTGSAWDDTAVPVDSRGELVSVPAGVRVQRLLDFGPGHPQGKYLVTWRGDANALTVTNGQSDGPNRIVFARTETNNRLLLTARNASVQNISVVSLSNSDAAGEWRPEFLKRLAPFGCIRMMNWTRTNDDRPGQAFGVPGASPAYLIQMERAVDLCNRLDADMWWCVHHRTDDAELARVGAYLRDSLNRTLHIEHSNEIWNTMFPQAKYARTQPSWVKWHIDRTSHIGDVLDSIGCKHTLWFGEQSAGHGRFFSDLGRLGLSRLPANIDGVTIAPYFGHKVGDVANAAAIRTGGVAWIAEQLMPAVDWTIGNVKHWKTWCDSQGLKLSAYEAGQHCVPSTTHHNDATILNAFDAIQRHPTMHAAYAKFLADWDTITNKSLVSMYADCAMLSRWGSWGLCEHEADVANGKYLAVTNHIAKVLQ